MAFVASQQGMFEKRVGMRVAAFASIRLQCGTGVSLQPGRWRGGAGVAQVFGGEGALRKAGREHRAAEEALPAFSISSIIL